MINIKLTKQVQYLRKKFLSENKTQIKIIKKKKANNYDNISSYDLK